MENVILILNKEIQKHMKVVNELARMVAYLESLNDGQPLLVKRATPRPYSDEEVLEMVRLREIEGLQWEEIGLRLDRNPSSLSGKYTRYKNGE